jgi:hypothetical protein
MKKSRRSAKKDRVESPLVRYFEGSATSGFSETGRGDKPMQRYDPLAAPDPEEWLALDEQERINLVRNYHHNARTRLPNAVVHAALHSTGTRRSTPSAGCSSNSWPTG